MKEESLLERIKLEMTPARLEIAAFVLLAILPLLPYLSLLHLFSGGVPRYAMSADFALIEHETRHVFAGETFLGLGSRFGWHHPGPLFFYFVAPFTALFGEKSTGIYLGTWVLVAGSVGVLAGFTRAFATRAQSIGVLAGIAAWFLAFGDVATNPWNRVVAVLPMVAYVGLAALFARGMKSAVYPLIFLGALVMETHVSTVTTIGAIGALAFVSFLAHAKKRGSLKRDAKHLLLAAVLLGVLIAPMLYEEKIRPVQQPPFVGNISKLIYFLRHREEPFRTYDNAFKNWALATSWLPDRILDGAIFHEKLPMVIRWDAVPIGLSTTARTLTAAHFITVIAALGVSIRRRDFTSLSLLLCGVAGEAIALSSLRALLGEDQYSLFFWITAPCTVTWMGIFSTLASWLGPRVLLLKKNGQRVLIAAGVLTVMFVTSAQRDWATDNVDAFARTNEDIRLTIHDIEERVQRTGEVPVLHLYGAWFIATAASLELGKDGVNVRYGKADAWSFAGGRTEDDVLAAGTNKPLHLWFSAPNEPFPIARCAEHLFKHNGLDVYGAPEDIDVCPP